MKAIEDMDVYWLVSSAGTFHVCKVPHDSWKFFEKYVSVCRQVRREEGVDKPIPYEELKQPPRGRKKCEKCMEKLDTWKSADRVVRVDKEAVMDAVKALRDDGSISDKREQEAMEELRSAIE